MKATEQYFPVVLFIVLYKVVFAFEYEIVETKLLNIFFYGVFSFSVLYSSKLGILG